MIYYYDNKPTIRCPFKYKYELINYVIMNCNFNKSTAQKMSKKQLYAIYYSK